MDTMLDDYLELAPKAINADVPAGWFDDAKRIFHNLISTPLTEGSTATNDKYIDSSTRLETIKALQVRASSLYARKGACKNQYRPIFMSKESILPGSKRINIDTVRKHDPPASAKGAATKKRKRAREKNKKKYASQKRKAVDKDDSRKPKGATQRDRNLRK
ncbi:hypothetical protein BGX26_001744 [Mortierella sp. AD094]|nr:hypothetical protein BGX26_001744 [Mortierella sp. AD094]